VEEERKGCIGGNDRVMGCWEREGEEVVRRGGVGKVWKGEGVS